MALQDGNNSNIIQGSSAALMSLSGILLTWRRLFTSTKDIVRILTMIIEVANPGNYIFE
jgi:hypothetical protein